MSHGCPVAVLLGSLAKGALLNARPKAANGGLGGGGLDALGLSWMSWDMIKKVRRADQRFCGITDAGRTERGVRAMGNGESAGQRPFRWVRVSGL